MSKGKRNREKRRDQKKSATATDASSVRPSADRDYTELIVALESVSTTSDLEALASEQPELFDDSMVLSLEAMRAKPAFAPLFQMFIDMLLGRRTDPRAAWRRFSERMEETEASGEGLEHADDRVRAAILEGDFQAAEDLAARALEHATKYGLGIAALILHETIARSLFETTEGDRARNIDAAIEHGIATLEFAANPAHYAELGTNLALMFTARKNGDPSDNLERAIAGLREALAAANPATPSDLVGNIQTNLAHNLELRQREDRLQNLEEARDLCLAALTWRSPDRNVVDWAYSELNLGSIYDSLAELGEADASEAEASLNRVISEAGALTERPDLVAHAHASLGAVLRRRAESMAREERLVMGIDKPPPPSEAEAGLLSNAGHHLETAIELLDPRASREICGRAHVDLGAVLEGLGDIDGAVSQSRRALALLTPNLLPARCQRAGWRIGRLSALRADWEGAAEGFVAAMEAFDADFQSRLETVDRDGVSQGAGNLARWAAFALAKIGRVEDGIVALENGRTRELRRRLSVVADRERLGDLPEELANAYTEAGAALARAPLGSASDQAALNLQEIIAVIRERPEFSDFATGSNWSDIQRAVESNWPLLYVNPTPHGTALFLVQASDAGTTSDVIILDAPTSHDVFVTLATGDQLDLDEPASYLSTAAGAAQAEKLSKALEEALPKIGSGIGEPIWKLLGDRGCMNVTIVPCGFIGLAPIHTAPWELDGQAVCLLDYVTVRYAPSAIVSAECIDRARAANGDDRVLVALGNPDLRDPRLDLPGSEAEAREITERFDQEARLALREDATGRFLRDSAESATHLHLACHGKGGLIDPADSGLMLADGWLPATEIGEIPMTPRLTVLSACQTAISRIGELPDEVFSISTAFLAAGSACTVATLWSVDDVATGMLMCRFYELLAEGASPPEALRSAQLWLRNLKPDEEAIFLEAHPILAAEFSRRTVAGRRPGDHAPESDTAGVGNFHHQRFWAPFVAVGA